jgi:hypothetical protein
MAGFASVLTLEKFSGAHFKRWQVKAKLWLQPMNVFKVSIGMPKGSISEEDQRRFQKANVSLWDNS